MVKLHKATVSIVVLFVGLGMMPMQCAWASRWGVRHELREGAREIRRERAEAVVEILSADSPWEVRHEIREAGREIRREKREMRREVRRELRW